MKLWRGVSWAFIAVLWLPAGLRTQALSADTDYSARFACPESLESHEAREAAVTQFVDWAKSAHPDWTLQDLAGYRIRLLEAHHCDATLAAIRTPLPTEVEAEAGGVRLGTIIQVGLGVALAVLWHRRRRAG